MSTIICAIDVGSGYVKSISHLDDAARIDSYPSLIGEVSSLVVDEFEAESSDINIISFMGKTYVAGAGANRLVEAHDICDTLTFDWPGSEAWVALLILSMYRIGVKSGEKIHLVTGLPQQMHSSRKTEIAERIIGKHFIKIKGGKFEVEILPNPTVMPQAAAAIYRLKINQETPKDVRIGCIDAGTLTTGMAAIMPDGLPITTMSGGIDVGVSKVIDYMSKSLNEKYSASFDRSDLTRVLQSKSKAIVLRGKQISIKPETDLAITKAGNEIMTQVKGLWGKYIDTMQPYLLGGGSTVFAEYLQERIPHLICVSPADSRFYPVKGMLIYAAVKLRLQQSIGLK